LSETFDLVSLRTSIARAERTARKHPGDAAAARAVVDRRREYAEASLAAFVRRVVESAPPLTPDAADRIAALLRSGDGNVA
jgi:hypothetical protein